MGELQTLALTSLGAMSLVGLPTIPIPADSALPLHVQIAERDEHPFDGRYLHLREARRMLVTGDPGSGKSGLTRLIAYEALVQGKRVVRGRLKVVAAKVAGGSALGDALGVSVAEGYFSSAEALALLKDAELVLLDGLDETDGAHQAVVEHLASWPTDATIIVTSRDHRDLEHLGGFAHVRLTPVAKHDAQIFARWVEAQRGSVLDRVATTISELLDEHPELRTPLLIGFVLAIAFEACGDPLPTTPARLYDRIMKLLAQTTRADRPYKFVMDPAIALEVIACLAWQQREDPRADVETLRTRIRPDLQNVVPATISFWEERGVLETVRTSLTDTTEFAHQSIAEYCAALHLVTLGDVEIVRRVERYADESTWEPILKFAVGLGAASTVLRGVLASPEGLKTLLAARLARAAPTGLNHAMLSNRLVDALAPEHPPALVTESAAHLAYLIESGVADTTLVASRLTDHATRTKMWDRLGVLRVRVALVMVGVQTGDVAQWLLDEFETYADLELPYDSDTQNWWGTLQDLIAAVIEAVYLRHGEPPAMALVLELKRRELLTWHSIDKLLAWASRRGHSIVHALGAIRDDLTQESSLRTSGQEHAKHEAQRAEGLLRLFAEACPESALPQLDRGVSIAIVLQSCGYMGAPVSNSAIFVDERVRSRFAPIIRAWVLALGLAPAAVGDHARAMIASMSSVTWPFALMRLPRVPRKIPLWTDDIHRELPALPELVQLLNIGSQRTLVVSLLGPIVLSYESRARAEAVEMLSTDTRSTMWLWIMTHARELWGAEAPRRAAELTRGNVAPGALALLEVAPRDVLADPEIRARIRSAIMSTQIDGLRAPRVEDARVAARLLMKLSDAESLADAKRAFADWTAHPATDNPGRLPDSPLDLLAAYIAGSDSDDGTVRALATHSDSEVRSAAIAVLNRRPFDSALWDSYLGTNAEAQLVATVLSNAPTNTSERLTWLLGLVESPSASTRELTATALEEAPLIPEVEAALAKLTRDPNPAVRDRAFQTMRARSLGE